MHPPEEYPPEEYHNNWALYAKNPKDTYPRYYPPWVEHPYQPGASRPFNEDECDIEDGRYLFFEWLWLTGRQPPPTQATMDQADYMEKIVRGMLTATDHRWAALHHYIELLPPNAKLYKEKNGQGRTFYRVKFRKKVLPVPPPLPEYTLGHPRIPISCGWLNGGLRKTGLKLPDSGFYPSMR